MIHPVGHLAVNLAAFQVPVLVAVRALNRVHLLVDHLQAVQVNLPVIRLPMYQVPHLLQVRVNHLALALADRQVNRLVMVLLEILVGHLAPLRVLLLALALVQTLVKVQAILPANRLVKPHLAVSTLVVLRVTTQLQVRSQV